MASQWSGFEKPAYRNCASSKFQLRFGESRMKTATLFTLHYVVLAVLQALGVNQVARVGAETPSLLGASGFWTPQYANGALTCQRLSTKAHSIIPVAHNSSRTRPSSIQNATLLTFMPPFILIYMYMLELFFFFSFKFHSSIHMKNTEKKAKNTDWILKQLLEKKRKRKSVTETNKKKRSTVVESLEKYQH